MGMDEGDKISCHSDFVVAFLPKAKEDGETDLARRKGKRDEDAHDDKVVAIANGLLGPGRAVMLPGGAKDLLAVSQEKGIVDCEAESVFPGEKGGHDERGNRQAQGINRLCDDKRRNGRRENGPTGMRGEPR